MTSVNYCTSTISDSPQFLRGLKLKFSELSHYDLDSFSSELFGTLVHTEHSIISAPEQLPVTYNFYIGLQMKVAMYFVLGHCDICICSFGLLSYRQTLT